MYARLVADRLAGTDESLAEAPLHRSAGDAGWRLTRYDDAVQRFLALAVRR
jgi:hypothetical protein